MHRHVGLGAPERGDAPRAKRGRRAAARGVGNAPPPTLCPDSNVERPVGEAKVGWGGDSEAAGGAGAAPAHARARPVRGNRAAGRGTVAGGRRACVVVVAVMPGR